MGEAASPATWMTAISGVVFALLFTLFERARPPKTDKTSD
jgi:hypothetical protein